MGFLAVDPGLRGCGVAYFADDKLRLAAYVVGKYQHGRGPEVWRGMASAVRKWWGETAALDGLVLEVPEIYPGMPKTDPNDLIDLAGVDGALAAAFAVPAVYYLPRQWKGQVPKEVGVLRALAHLSDEERKCVRPAPMKSLDHNVADAVGLGLYHVGRFRQVKVFR